MVLQALAELVQLQRRKASKKIRSRLFPTGTQKQWGKTNNFQAAALALELITPYQATNPQFTED